MQRVEPAVLSHCTFEDPANYRKSVLDNGIRIITERIPYLQSVSVGIWVRSGSRFELPKVNGICHFIEHMLFKGTDRRNAYEIAKEIDSVGGVINAFTSKELTSVYCKVLTEHLPVAVDLLTDIYLNASFPPDEIEREKQVIFQEIFAMEDNPEDLIHEILTMRFWSDDPLGQPILGTVSTVTGLDRDTLMEFKRAHYTPEETLVCAAGNVDHDEFVTLMAKEMGGLPTSPAQTLSPFVQSPSAHVVVPKDLEQVHLCVGMAGPSAVDDRRHATYLLNAILGGGMSSKLFQEVREKRGLAYTVYSFLSSFSDTGMFGVYAGCEPARFDELLEVMGRETLALTGHISEEDLVLAKNQIKGSIVFAMESSDSRMNRLAKGELFFGRYVPMAEIIAALEGVTCEELGAIAKEIIDAERFTIVALGPVEENGDLRKRFVGGA